MLKGLNLAAFGYDSNDNIITQRRVAIDSSQIYVSNFMDPIKYGISACNETICGDEIQDSKFNQGLSRVSRLTTQWDFSTANPQFKFDFRYFELSGWLQDTLAQSIKPDEFRVIADFPQSNGLTLLATILVPSTGELPSQWQSDYFNYDDIVGNSFKIYACNTLFGCGSATEITISLPVSSSNLPTPSWVNVSKNLGKQTQIKLEWHLTGSVDNECNSATIADLDCVDYIEVNEWQPKIQADSLYHQVSSINDKHHRVYYIDKVDAPLILSRLTYSGYDFDLRSCHRDRENGDVCSEFTGGYQELSQSDPECTTAKLCNLGVSDIVLNRSDVNTSSLNNAKPINVNWYVPREAQFGFQRQIVWELPNSIKPDYFYLKSSGQNGCRIDSDTYIDELTIDYADKITHLQNNKWVTEVDCFRMKRLVSWTIQSCFNGVGCSSAESIILNDDMSTRVTDPTPTNSRSGNTSPSINIAQAGPGGLSPGMWWNQGVSGSGWHFFFANELGNSLESSYDLIGYWYTYREMNGVWTPTWIEARMMQRSEVNGDIYYDGSLKYYDNNLNLTEMEAGKVKLLLKSDKNHATLKINPTIGNGLFSQPNAQDLGPYTEVGGEYTLEINNFSLDHNAINGSSPNNNDHFSGVWQHKDATTQALKVSVITWIENGFENTIYATFDTQGVPIWLVAVNICTDTTGSCHSVGSYFEDFDNGEVYDQNGISVGTGNLGMVSYGFNPLAGKPLNHDFGSIDNITTNYHGNTGRCLNNGEAQEKYKKGSFWFKMIEQLSYPAIGGDSSFTRHVIDYGSQANQCNNSSLEKVASLHNIDFNIEGQDINDVVCSPESPGDCVINFNWYTDDDFPSVTPFYSVDNGQSYALLSELCPNPIPTNHYIMPLYTCDLTASPGNYIFQLRKQNYNSSIKDVVIAESKGLSIDSCQNSCLASIEVVVDGELEEIDESIANQPGAGPIPGSGGVSGGSATYTLPLVIPPGRNGMTPSLSVNYSSKGGNGILGVGWSLSIGSSIYRCPQTLAQDGSNIPVRLDNTTDRLCLDGQRLMEVSGADYFATGAEYRTEQDSFTKVTKTSTGFSVKTKSGRTNTYVQQGAQQTTWQLIREEDSFGNNINYYYNSYDSLPETFGINETLLTEIYYTGFAQQDGDRKVRLNYANRIDENASYLAGLRTDITQVLDNIQTYTINEAGISNAERNYEFTLVSSKITNRSLLNKVEENIGGLNSSTNRVLFNSFWSHDDEDSGWEQKVDVNGNIYYTPQQKLLRVGLEELGVIQQDYWNEFNTGYDVFMNGVTRIQTRGDVNGDGINELAISYRYLENNNLYKAGTQAVNLSPDGEVDQRFIGAHLSHRAIDFDTDGRNDVASFENTATPGEFELVITKWDSSKGTIANDGNLHDLSEQFETIHTGLKLSSEKRPFGSQFYDYDHDGDYDLFLTDYDVEPSHDSCITNPLPEDSSVKCKKIYLYENYYDSTNTGLGTSKGIDFRNSFFNREQVASIEVKNNSSNALLYFQLLSGIQDINNDGTPELIIKTIPTLGGSFSPFNTYLGIRDPNSSFIFDTKITMDDLNLGSFFRYHQWIDVNKDGLNDLIVISQGNNDGLVWAVKINKGGELINSLGEVQDIFTDQYKSKSNIYLYPGTGKKYEYGFPVENPGTCTTCSNSPRRANSIKQIDLNSDGTNELIIANPDNIYWNFCRSYAAYCSACTGPARAANFDPQLVCPGNGATTQVNEGGYALPATDYQTCLLDDDIRNNLYPRELPLNSPTQSLGAVTEVLFYCANPSEDPGTIAYSASNLYEPNSNPPAMADDVPYLGSYDRSIYSFDSIEFDLDLSGANITLQVKSHPTSMVGDISKTGQIDIDNDGINELYSKLGCEFTGCMSAHGIGAYPEIFDSSGNIRSDSVFRQYLIDYFSVDGTVAGVNKQEFFDEIDESRSMIINKTNAVMPDMLVKIEKPSTRTNVEWEYLTLNTKLDSLPNRVDFPLYQVKERNCSASQHSITPDQCDSYLNEDGIKGDHFYFNSSMYVVSEMRQTNNYGNDAVTEYAYEEAVYNNKGRGFQGFRKISVRSRPDESAQGVEFESVSESTFHQVFPKAGKLEQIKVYNQGALTQQEDYNYATTNQSNNDEFGVVYYPLISKSSQNIELNNGFLSSSNSTIISNDNYGNITSQTNVINTYDATNGLVTLTRSESVETLNEYNPADTSNWWVDQLAKTTVTKQATNNSEHKVYSEFYWKPGVKRILDCQFSYIGNENINPSPQRECSSAITNNNISKNTFLYDEVYGNIINVTTTATNSDNVAVERTVDTLYTTDGYFPVFIEKDRAGASLIESFSYDPSTGQVRQQIAADGNYVYSVYDAYGFKVRSEAKFGIADGNQIPIAYSTMSNNIESDEQNIINTISSAVTDDASIDNLILGSPQLTYLTEQRQDGQPRVITWYDNLNKPVLTKTYHSDNTGSNKYSYVASITTPAGSTITSQPFVDTNEVYLSISLADPQGRIRKKYTQIGDLSDGSIGNCKLITTYNHAGGYTNIEVNQDQCASNSTDITTLSMSRTYDATGKLLNTEDDQNNVVTYKYDSSGNPKELIDAHTNTIFTTFDALGRKKTVNDPNMGTKVFQYNGFGEVSSQQYIGEDYSTYYSYDNIGRISQQFSNVTASLAPVQNVRSYHDIYQYDDRRGGLLASVNRESNKFSINGNDNVFSPVFTKIIEYDNQNRMAAEITNLPAALTQNSNTPIARDIREYKTEYYYHGKYNRLKQVIYNHRYSIFNTYTRHGTLKSQVDVLSNETLMEITGWNFKGQETSRKLNGLFDITTQYYPSTGQVAHINNSSAAQGYEALNYKYDPWGNIKQQLLNRNNNHGDIGGIEESFIYDSLHRLITAYVNPTSQKTYNYNGIGNITTKSDFSNNYSYGNQCSSAQKAGPNAVCSASLINGNGTMTYHYDDRGNRIQDTTTLNHTADYQYDYNNLLVESTSNITGNPQILEFNYGADNQRYRKYDAQNTEITLYANKDYEEIYKNGARYPTQTKYYLTSYLTLTRKVSGEITRHFMQKDRLGSTTQIQYIPIP